MDPEALILVLYTYSTQFIWTVIAKLAKKCLAKERVHDTSHTLLLTLSEPVSLIALFSGGIYRELAVRFILRETALWPIQSGFGQVADYLEL